MVDFHHAPHLFLKMKKIGCSKGHGVFPFIGLAYIRSDFTGRCFYCLYLKPSVLVYS